MYTCKTSASIANIVEQSRESECKSKSDAFTFLYNLHPGCYLTFTLLHSAVTHMFTCAKSWSHNCSLCTCARQVRSLPRCPGMPLNFEAVWVVPHTLYVFQKEKEISDTGDQHIRIKFQSHLQFSKCLLELTYPPGYFPND